MKIGILTFHRSYNYGAFLQSFSLQKRLQKDLKGHQIEIIDYTSDKIMEHYSNHLNSLRANLLDWKRKKRLIVRNNAIKSVEDTIQCTSFSEVSSDYLKVFNYIEKNNYDIIIVGSDAVWNWTIREIPNVYFLNGLNDVVKMSYAASAYGQPYLSLKEEEKQYLNESFKQFDYLGVRDNETARFVNSFFNEAKINHNCDPTFLLDFNDIKAYRRTLEAKMKKKGIDLNKPMIGIMANDRVTKKHLSVFRKKYQIVAIYEPNKSSDFFLNDLNPYEWALIFSYFELTITHFFHGTILSLMNRVPVVAIDFPDYYNDSYETKINDVMKRLDLKDLYFTSPVANQQWNDIILSIIDRKKEISNKINNAVERESEFYNNFLKFILEKIDNEKQTS